MKELISEFVPRMQHFHCCLGELWNMMWTRDWKTFLWHKDELVSHEQQEEGGEEEGRDQEAVPASSHKGVWWKAEQRPVDKSSPWCKNP